jgi:hypothetical protein
MNYSLQKIKIQNGARVPYVNRYSLTSVPLFPEQCIADNKDCTERTTIIDDEFNIIEGPNGKK